MWTKKTKEKSAAAIALLPGWTWDLYLCMCVLACVHRVVCLMVYVLGFVMVLYVFLFLFHFLDLRVTAV